MESWRVWKTAVLNSTEDFALAMQSLWERSQREGREQVMSILAQKVVQAITLGCLGKKIPQTKYTGSKMLERALCN